MLRKYAQIEWDSREQDSTEELPELASLVWLFANVQRIDPDPATLRGYSQSSRARRMGEHGENFAALIKTIAQDEDALDAYLTWLRQLRPAEVIEVVEAARRPGERTTYGVNRAWTPAMAVEVMNIVPAREWFEQPCETLNCTAGHDPLQVLSLPAARSSASVRPRYL